MKTERQRGLALYGEIYGAEAAEAMTKTIETGSRFSKQAEWTIDWAFGSVWSRTGLARKMRSCVVLGMLIAQRSAEEMRYHVRMAIENGLSAEELEEIVYTTIPYAGFPAAAAAKRIIVEEIARAEQG